MNPSPPLSSHQRSRADNTVTLAASTFLCNMTWLFVLLSAHRLSIDSIAEAGQPTGTHSSLSLKRIEVFLVFLIGVFSLQFL
jgi:hypothetical protein